MKKNLPEGMRKRGTVYWADFSQNGRRIRKSLSKNLKTAKALLTELRARVERSDFGLIDDDAPLEGLRKQFMQHCRQTLKASSVRTYEAALAQILPAMPPKASQLTSQAVMSYREQRLAQGITPTKVNYDVNTLGRLLRWSVKNRLIGQNALTGIRPLRERDDAGSRALERPEVEALLAFSPPHWRDIWYAYLVTGMRNQELATLTFDDIDWEAREVIVRAAKSKSGRERRIPVDNGLWQILHYQRDTRHDRRARTNRNAKYSAQVTAKLTHDHVFVSTANTWMRMSRVHAALMRCLAKAGIESKTFDEEGREASRIDVHSLRKTFATELIETGADPKSVQELLGHRTLDITMRLYAKVRKGTKRQAVARLSYGQGVQSPEHLIEFPICHNSVTVEERGEADESQAVAQ